VLTDDTELITEDEEEDTEPDIVEDELPMCGCEEEDFESAGQNRHGVADARAAR
jgi:hypothetical protein